MEKIRALWSLFQLGRSVADPAKWKAHQVSANAAAAVLLAIVALLRSFGVHFPISDDQALSIGGGVVALANVVLTVISTDKIGIDGRTHADVAAMAVATAAAAAADSPRTDVARGDTSLVQGSSVDRHAAGVDVADDRTTNPFREHGS